MPRPHVPDAVLTAAHERAKARAARDWAVADRLRSEIEAAGWTIVDRGTDFALSPSAPPDMLDGDAVRYGSSRSVPALLDEPADGPATVVLVATDWPSDIERALDGLWRSSPPGTSIVVVTDAAADERLAALVGPDRDDTEVIRTSERLGHAAALNAGIRRARGSVVIVLDGSVEPVGDLVTPLAAALDAPSVAIVGGFGISSTDLRTFVDAPAGDVDAIEGYCQAFRRRDYAVLGPLDERFRFYRNLDIWWSLVLRDGDGAGGVAPRRAVALAGLPLVRHEHRGWASLPDAERDRQSRRNFYRIIDRFGSRRDLLVATASERA